MFDLRPPPYALVRTADPVEEPVLLADAKAWLRIDPSFTADDAKIGGLITAARIEGERISGRRFCVATWRMTLDRFAPLVPRPRRAGYDGDRVGFGDYAGYGYGWTAVAPHWPAIRLPGPATAVTLVQYYDASETLQTLDPSQYQFSADYRPSLLVVRYPPVTYPRPDAVQITFTAGQPAATLGQNVKTALLMAVAAWYDPDTAGPPEKDWADSMPPRSVSMLTGEWDGELSHGR